MYGGSPYGASASGAYPIVGGYTNVILFTGHAGTVSFHQLPLASEAGGVSFVGYPVAITFVWAHKSPYGVIDFSRIAPAVEMRWTGLSPYGVLEFPADGIALQAVTQPQNLGSSYRALKFRGSPVTPDQKPTLIPLSLFPGYSSDGTSITIPIAALVEVTSAEADTITGDWREVLQGVLRRAAEHLGELMFYDEPTTLRVFVLNDYNARSAILGDGLKRDIVVKFNITYQSCGMPPEPD